MKYLLICLLALFIIGCTSKPKEIVLVEYEYITINLPSTLTTSCKPSRPIPEEEYRAMNQEQRTIYLANYASTLMGELKKCDNKIKSIVNYVTRYNENMSNFKKE